MTTSCFGLELTLYGVRIKLIQQNDLGNGKIRLNFAWGVEKVNFGATLRQEGIKKAFFRVDFFCIDGDSSPRPDVRKIGFFSATPFLDSLPIPTSNWAFFYFHAKPLVAKGFAKQYPIPQILRRDDLPGGRTRNFNEKCPKFSAGLEQATSPRRSPENRLNEKHTPV